MGTDPMERQGSRLLKPEPTTPQNKHGAPVAYDGAMWSCRSGARGLDALRQAPPRPFQLSFCTRTRASTGTSAGVHCREPMPASLNRRPGPGRGNQHGRCQRRPRMSPRPGVRVHGSTHRPFQPVTASVLLSIPLPMCMHEPKHLFLCYTSRIARAHAHPAVYLIHTRRDGRRTIP